MVTIKHSKFLMVAEKNFHFFSWEVSRCLSPEKNDFECLFMKTRNILFQIPYNVTYWNTVFFVYNVFLGLGLSHSNRVKNGLKLLGKIITSNIFGLWFFFFFFLEKYQFETRLNYFVKLDRKQRISWRVGKFSRKTSQFTQQFLTFSSYKKIYIWWSIEGMFKLTLTLCSTYLFFKPFQSFCE